jgi:hypothetical protein
MSFNFYSAIYLHGVTHKKSYLVVVVVVVVSAAAVELVEEESTISILDWLIYTCTFSMCKYMFRNRFANSIFI